MGSGTPCASGILRKENPAPAVLARRGMGAGSACGAAWGAGSACRTCRMRGVRRILMGGDTLCICCNWHEKNPARQGGKGCRLSLPDQSAFMRRHMAAEVPMGSDTAYNERRLLWKAVRFVCAVTYIRTAPRPVGANCMQAQPAEPVRFYARLPHARRAGGLNPLSSALAASAACEGFLWAVICFVWAVSCVRRTPRRRREEHAGSTRPP